MKVVRHVTCDGKIREHSSFNDGSDETYAYCSKCGQSIVWEYQVYVTDEDEDEQTRSTE